MIRLVLPPTAGRLSRNRPRRCRECHTPATHVEVAQRPAAVLQRDGMIGRFTEDVRVYWCDEHTGLRGRA